MLKPGGFLLSNDKLPDAVPSGLNDMLETPIVSSLEPLIKDTVFCYQRTKRLSCVLVTRKEGRSEVRDRTVYKNWELRRVGCSSSPIR